MANRASSRIKGNGSVSIIGDGNRVAIGVRRAARHAPRSRLTWGDRSTHWLKTRRAKNGREYQSEAPRVLVSVPMAGFVVSVMAVTGPLWALIAILEGISVPSWYGVVPMWMGAIGMVVFGSWLGMRGERMDELAQENREIDEVLRHRAD